MGPQFTHRFTKTKARYPNTIRSYRLRLGWTQRTLAGVLGSNRSTISAWECGHRLPSMARLLSLRKTLNAHSKTLYTNLVTMR